MATLFFSASCLPLSLPAHASEQGNVIGSVRIYICVYKKIVIERTRDLIYLKFVATDFLPKIISLSAGENSGDLTLSPPSFYSNFELYLHLFLYHMNC